MQNRDCSFGAFGCIAMSPASHRAAAGRWGTELGAAMVLGRAGCRLARERAALPLGCDSEERPLSESCSRLTKRLLAFVSGDGWAGLTPAVPRS